MALDCPQRPSPPPRRRRSGRHLWEVLLPGHRPGARRPDRAPSPSTAPSTRWVSPPTTSTPLRSDWAYGTRPRYPRPRPPPPPPPSPGTWVPAAGDHPRPPMWSTESGRPRGVLPQLWPAAGVSPCRRPSWTWHGSLPRTESELLRRRPPSHRDGSVPAETSPPGAER